MSKFQVGEEVLYKGVKCTISGVMEISQGFPIYTLLGAMIPINETDIVGIVKTQDYVDMVNSLAKPGEDIIVTLTPEMAHNWHMATGVSGEAGELLDAVKKYAIYNKPADRENIIEELGDLEFYMEGLRQGFNISREETLYANVKKLGVRYSSKKYSDKQAQERADKTGEENGSN